MVQIEDILLCCSQKSGYDKADFEDAFTPLTAFNKNNKNIKIAIADGATESSFSKEWANILVKKYLSDDFEINNKDEIGSAAKEWESLTAQNNLEWFATEKLNNGAHAAFLGLQIDRERQAFEVESVGDCCLFVIRNNSLITHFPIENHSDFTNNPKLLSTKNPESVDNLKRMNGLLLSGDIIILASDALSAFIMKEKNNNSWEFFVQLLTKQAKKKEKEKIFNNWQYIKKQWQKYNENAKVDDFHDLVFETKANDKDVEMWSFNNWIFKNWLELQRNLGLIKNDDTTLYLIKLS